MNNVLKAWIRKNNLTEDPNDFTAVVLTSSSVGVKEIVDELVKEGMEIKRETVIDIVTRFNRKSAEMVVSGHNVNTGLVYMRPIITGVFYDKTWSAEKNPVYVTINQGVDLRAAIAETTVEILGEQSEPIEILSLTDTTTGKTDGTLTKGRNAELKGSYLKIVGENPDCGISFKNTATQEITQLEIGDLVLNEPSRLLILVPDSLTAGEYELTITTQYSKGKYTLKDPRSVTFSTPVIIG